MSIMMGHFLRKSGMRDIRRAMPRLAYALAVVTTTWLLPSIGMAQDTSQPSSSAPSYTLQGRVVHVQDGDSFTVLAAGRRQRAGL